MVGGREDKEHDNTTETRSRCNGNRCYYKIMVILITVIIVAVSVEQLMPAVAVTGPTATAPEKLGEQKNEIIFNY